MSQANQFVPPSDFFTFISPFCVDAPDELMDQYVREASVWFARETRALEDEIEVHFQPNVADYALPLPDGRELIALDYSRERLHNRHKMIDRATHFWVMELFGTYDLIPRWRKDGRFPVVEFPVSPLCGGRHRLWYQWTPARDACLVPRFFYEDYEPYITAYALSKILRINKQSWTNIGLADHYRAIADMGIEAARIRRFSNYTQGERRMHARPFLRPRGFMGYGGGFW